MEMFQPLEDGSVRVREFERLPIAGRDWTQSVDVTVPVEVARKYYAHFVKIGFKDGRV